NDETGQWRHVRLGGIAGERRQRARGRSLAVVEFRVSSPPREGAESAVGLHPRTPPAVAAWVSAFPEESSGAECPRVLWPSAFPPGSSASARGRDRPLAGRGLHAVLGRLRPRGRARGR